MDVGKPRRFGRVAVLMFLTFVVVGMLLAVFAPAAEATTLEKLSLEQLIQRATTIVVARTASTSSEIAKPDGLASSGFLQTRVNVRVLQVLKGSPGPTVSVTVPGGRMGGVSAVVDGMPDFAPGETSLLFLDEKQRVIGGTQGKLPVVDGVVEPLHLALGSLKARIDVGIKGGKTPGGSEPGSRLGSSLKSGSGSDFPGASAMPSLPRGSTSGTLDVQAQAILPLTFTDGFETSMSGWSTEGAPTWGRESYRQSSGSYSAYCAGSWYTAPASYPINMDSWMARGPFDLSGATAATFTFDLWLDSEYGYDWIWFGVDTGDDYYYMGYTGYSAGWMPVSLDLAAIPGPDGATIDVTGEPNVWLVFGFVSDGSDLDHSHEGAYVDQVSLTTASPPLTRYEQDDTHIDYSGDWYDYAKTAASGGSYGRSNTPGASATIYFDGSRIDWIAMTGSTPGQVDVYLDDVYKSTVDLYSSPAVYNRKVWSSGNITDGGHKLELELSGSSDLGEFITLDAVDVIGDLTDAPPPPPTITGISPGMASAGTGSRVTITGTGFGSTPGIAGSVDFFYQSGQPTIPGDIVSWSDRSIVVEVPVGTVNDYPGSAGSGPVTVTNADGATSDGFGFQVTFGYGEARWAGSSVSYRVNPNCADTAQEQALVDAAAATWSDPSVFAYVDAGTCSTTNFFDDGQNDLFWSSEILPSGIIAAALPEVSGSIISECDVCFNDDYLWGDGTSGTMDIQTVALHEMGHWLELRDLYGSADSAKVMYGFGNYGQQKRTLTVADRDGVIWIYGAPPTPSIASVSPEMGPVAGGTTVVITGTGFEGLYGPSAVRFGPADAASYIVDSPTQITAVTPTDPGVYAGVTVTNAGGTSNQVEFRYVSVPTITQLSPASGPSAGGNTVYIQGYGFEGTSGPSAVTFGGVDASEYVVNSGMFITAVVPPHVQGMVDVVVISAGGTSDPSGPADDYTYADPPTITGIEPAFGPEAGGNEVVITGTNFVVTADAWPVTFGEMNAGYVVHDSTHITATAPAHAAGTVDVVVNAAGGSTDPAGAVDDYTYKVVPAITALTPASGPTAGGTEVTIAGTGFTDVSGPGGVSFGGVNAASYTVVSPTQISAVAPPHAAGTFDMVVTSGGIQSDTGGTGNDFTFIAPLPAVSAVEPHSGPTVGGTSVIITGVNFTGLSGPSAVTFGGTNASNYTVDSATRIMAVAPAHAAGTVDVVVNTTVGSSSPAGTGNDFTYVAPTRYEQDRSEIEKTGDWYDFAKPGLASGDSYGRSNTPGASATVSFTGTRIDWIAMTGSTPGKVDVYLDEEKQTTIDLSSSPAAYNQPVWSSGPLTDEAHTLELRLSDSSDPGEYLTLDALDIWGEITGGP